MSGLNCTMTVQVAPEASVVWVALPQVDRIGTTR